MGRYAHETSTFCHAHAIWQNTLWEERSVEIEEEKEDEEEEKVDFHQLFSLSFSSNL